MDIEKKGSLPKSLSDVENPYKIAIPAIHAVSSEFHELLRSLNIDFEKMNMDCVDTDCQASATCEPYKSLLSPADIQIEGRFCDVDIPDCVSIASIFFSGNIKLRSRKEINDAFRKAHIDYKVKDGEVALVNEMLVDRFGSTGIYGLTLGDIDELASLRSGFIYFQDELRKINVECDLRYEHIREIKRVCMANDNKVSVKEILDIIGETA